MPQQHPYRPLSPSPQREPFTTDVAVPIDRALDAVEAAADLWAGDWQRRGTGGRLGLPIRAGLRYGFVEGELSSVRLGDGCRLRFDVEHTHFRVNASAVAVLVLGALGALFTVVVPLVPDLLGLLPAALLLMLLAWFLVAARVRHRNENDFLELVAALALAPPLEHDEGDDDGNEQGRLIAAP